jgi:probable HAF family extracellular repeat protein
MKRKGTLIMLAFILAVAAPIQQASAYYKIIDLGTLNGCPSSDARSINNHGQIVGWVSYDSSNFATLFDSTGGGHNIGLWGWQGEVWSINDNGQIVGGRIWPPDAPPPPPIATLFDPTGSGKNISLGTLGGDSSKAFSINNHGQIVGYAEDWSGFQRATLFDPTGGGHNIALGEWGSEARSINDNSQIVGRAGGAALFDPTGGGNNIALSNLTSGALSINNNGQIVGWVWVSYRPVTQRATVFDPTGGGNNIDLGTLGGTNSCAWSINDNGQIIGWADDGSGNMKAALFDPTGGGNNIDLNTLIDPSLGWTLKAAFSINDNGWTVGRGINPAGFERAYLLIPEPATLSILAAGALFLLRKRQRSG